MKYENVSRKTLKLPSKSVEPGDQVEKTDLNEGDIENFEARGYLEKVENSSQDEETASAPEGSSGGQDVSDESSDESDVREPSQEFTDNLQKLEGIGGAKAEKIGRDWDSWSTFRDNVDRDYLTDQGLRKDQVEANLEKLEEME